MLTTYNIHNIANRRLEKSNERKKKTRKNLSKEAEKKAVLFELFHEINNLRHRGEVALRIHKQKYDR